jgi:hypothetical protein
MKNKFTILLLGAITTLFFLESCKKDDEVTCISCSSEITMTFTLCREANGNASVNGEDTGTPYDVYYQGLVEEEVTCQ